MKKLFIIIGIIILHYGAVSAEYLNRTEDASGWTVFTPTAPPDAYATRIMYVSAVDDVGDGNIGDGTYYNSDDAAVGSDPFDPDGPMDVYPTFASAKSQVRNGYPDWILFKRGETFDYTSSGLGSWGAFSGRGETEPILIGAYGSSGEPPTLDIAKNRGIGLGDSVSYVAFTNLRWLNSVAAVVSQPSDYDEETHFGASNNAVYLYNYMGNKNYNGLLFEGNIFDNCWYGIRSIQGDTGSNTYIAVRRNVFKRGFWGTSFYRNDGPMLFEENIFYHVGYVTTRDALNHCQYHSGSKSQTFSKNIYLYGAAAGIKLRRTSATAPLIGNVIDDNLFVECQWGISSSAGDDGVAENNDIDMAWYHSNMRVSNNIFTNMAVSEMTSAVTPASVGIGVGGLDGAMIANNIVANYTASDVTPIGINITGEARNSKWADNIIYNLRNSGIGIQVGYDSLLGSEAIVNNEISSNKIQLNTSGGCLLRSWLWELTAANYDIAGNTYNTTAAADSRFYYDGAVTDANWITNTGDDWGGSLSQISFTDATRDVDTWHSTVNGGAGTVAAFAEACAAQSRYSWDADINAAEINDWIRAGFDLDEYGTGTISTSFSGSFSSGGAN